MFRTIPGDAFRRFPWRLAPGERSPRRLAIEARRAVGGLYPSPCGGIVVGEGKHGGVGGAKVGRRSRWISPWKRLFRPRAAFVSPLRRSEQAGPRCLRSEIVSFLLSALKTVEPRRRQGTSIHISS